MSEVVLNTLEELKEIEIVWHNDSEVMHIKANNAILKLLDSLAPEVADKWRTMSLNSV